MSQYFDLQSVLMRRLALVAAIVCAVLIGYLSLLPATSLASVQWSDKVQHFIAYTALSAPLAVALGRPRWWLAIGIAVGFGALIEIAQGTMAVGRSADLLDVVANTIGACLGVGVTSVLLGLRRT